MLQAAAAAFDANQHMLNVFTFFFGFPDPFHARNRAHTQSQRWAVSTAEQRAVKKSFVPPPVPPPPPTCALVWMAGCCMQVFPTYSDTFIRTNRSKWKGRENAIAPRQGNKKPCRPREGHFRVWNCQNVSIINQRKVFFWSSFETSSFLCPFYVFIHFILYSVV